MTNRIPTQNDLFKLSREEWEDLCALICSTNYSAHRVEDHFGRGNGLDSYREVNEAVEGWQFRRFNDRFGAEQAKKLKENIVLAKNRCLLELNKPLQKFTVVFNIDPEPGHKNTKGEIQRLHELEEWAKNEHCIEFKYNGVTWVLQMLLKNPSLKPTLFEDVNAAIENAKISLQNDIFDIKKELESLKEQNSLAGKLKETFDLLLNEANIHYDRGLKLESGEEYRKSITSLKDALRLIENRQIDTTLEGKILSFLAGVEVVTGFLNDAIFHAEKAVNLLEEDKNSTNYYRFSKGNLAFALYVNQEYERSKELFIEVLRGFENDGNLIEIVRTLSHLIQLEIDANSINSAVALIDRIQYSSKMLDKLIGASDVTVSSLGTVANLYAEIGIKTGDRETTKQAISIFQNIESAAKKNQSFKRMQLCSKLSRAKCIWCLDKFQEAELLYRELIVEAKDFLPKVSIDAKYNLALLLIELNQRQRSKQLLSEAVTEYEKIGDFPSVMDAKKMLNKI